MKLIERLKNARGGDQRRAQVRQWLSARMAEAKAGDSAQFCEVLRCMKAELQKVVNLYAEREEELARRQSRYEAAREKKERVECLQKIQSLWDDVRTYYNTD